MIQLLEERQLGLSPSWVFPKICGNHRWTQIDLSGSKELVRSHMKGVNTLDMDITSYRYLLSGTTDGSIYIHDILTPVGVADYKCPLITSIRGSTRPSAHSHGISMVQWYPHDTGIFTSSSVDKTLRIWDTNEMCVVEKFDFTCSLYCHKMAQAINHTLIAVGAQDGNVTLCDINSGSSAHILRQHKKAVLCLQWSPHNENLLATGSQDNCILLWDIRKAKGALISLDQHNGDGGKSSASVCTAHNGFVSGLHFTSDGLFLVSSGTDERVRLWDVFSGTNMLINYGRIIHNFKHQSHQFTLTPHTLSYTPLLLIPSRSDIVMYNLFSGEQVKKLRGHYGRVTSCICNATDIECYTSSSDGTVLIWSPKLAEKQPPKEGVSSQAAVYNDAWSDED